MSTLKVSRALVGSLSRSCPSCGKVVHNCYYDTRGNIVLPTHINATYTANCKPVPPQKRSERVAARASVPKPERATTEVAPLAVPVVSAVPVPKTPAATIVVNTAVPVLTPKAEITVGVFDPANGRYPTRVVSPAEYVKLFDEGRLVFQQKDRVRPSHLPTREEALAWSRLANK